MVIAFCITDFIKFCAVCPQIDNIRINHFLDHLVQSEGLPQYSLLPPTGTCTHLSPLIHCSPQLPGPREENPVYVPNLLVGAYKGL